MAGRRAIRRVCLGSGPSWKSPPSTRTSRARTTSASWHAWRAFRDRIDRALEEVDLLGRAGDLTKTYSQGMRQRLGVAAALLKDPELLILDEPTNGLDPAGMAEMRTLVREAPRSGDRTVLLSSHLLGEVQQVGDRVGVISHGGLIAEGTVRSSADGDRSWFAPSPWPLPGSGPSGWWGRGTSRWWTAPFGSPPTRRTSLGSTASWCSRASP